MTPARVTSMRIAAILVLLLGVNTIPIARAAEEIPPLIDHFDIKIGGYFTSLDTTLRLDVNSEDLGSLVKFEDDLDFNKTHTVIRISAAMLFKERHQLQLGYYGLDRSSSDRIEEEIEWGDETFPVNADVKGFFNLDFIELSYTYWALKKEKTALGVNLGLVAVGLETGLGLQGEGEQGFSTETDVNTDVPVPLIGAQVRYAIIPRLLLIGKGDFIYVNSLGDYSGTVFFLGGGLEFRAFEHVGFGLFYDYGHLDVQAQRQVLTGEIDYTMQGVEGYIRFNF